MTGIYTEELLKDCEAENERLRKEIGRLQVEREGLVKDLLALVDDLVMAQGQWGDDYLWSKWGCSDSLKRPGVKQLMEMT
jgi:hypothetical protein